MKVNALESSCIIIKFTAQTKEQVFAVLQTDTEMVAKEKDGFTY